MNLSDYSEASKVPPPCPDDVLKVSRYNVKIHLILGFWRTGTLTWEQALILMVTELARDNEAMNKEMMKMYYESSKTIIVNKPV